VVGRFHEADGKMETQKQTLRLVREGHYLAEVQVNLIVDETGWSPYLTPDDARKLDAVRIALKQGDLETAKRLGRVFELLPISA
jgi:hypothetical protein